MNAKQAWVTAGSVKGAGQISVTGNRWGGVAGWTTIQRERPGSSDAKVETGKLEDAMLILTISARSLEASAPEKRSSR